MLTGIKERDNSLETFVKLTDNPYIFFRIVKILLMANPARKHIMVGMSGGVDSSVAAYLLKDSGHLVTGLFMKNWDEENPTSDCPATKDLMDAQKICDLLEIELRTINFSAEYWAQVFNIFLAEYRIGRTPNPDILCNKEIKFKAFLHYAKQYGADLIGTGHYARLQYHGERVQLLKAKDASKDQSYFLYALNQSQLSQSIFPLGEMQKSSVRMLAKKLGFNNHNKKDSTGICFIGERKFKTFLQEYLPTQPGPIETLEGEIIGEHEGLMFYTLGQRQGLAIGGRKHKSELPWYVAQKNLTDNKLIVIQGEHHPALYQSELTASEIHWIDQPPKTNHLKAKIRYRQLDQACKLERLTTKSYKVIFEQPQRTITPGQSIVFYQDDICLGGGIID